MVLEVRMLVTAGEGETGMGNEGEGLGHRGVLIKLHPCMPCVFYMCHTLIRGLF